MVQVVQMYTVRRWAKGERAKSGARRVGGGKATRVDMCRFAGTALGIPERCGIVESRKLGGHSLTTVHTKLEEVVSRARRRTHQWACNEGNGCYRCNVVEERVAGSR